ncbi:MAG TPA: CNNM domain-containing protein [Clostridia bacterium]|nr:CNNM domain-containing protein [Clostridia bacterium]
MMWILFGACLIISFLASGMEAGVFALSRLRIRQQMRAGRKSAKVLHDYLENPENFLWTILVGNTLANLFVFGWLLVVLHERTGKLALALPVFGALVFLFYGLFDLLPKMLFRMFPTRLCILLAQPFWVIHLAIRPLVALVESFSGMLLKWRRGNIFKGHLFGDREELRLVMQDSAQTFSSDERVMISRVLDLQSLTVRHVMRPLTEVVTVTAETPVSEVLRLARERGIARLPILETMAGSKRVIGLLNISSLLYSANLDETQQVRSMVQPALYLKEDTRLEVALRRMQRAGQRLAIVIGRDRRETGIISLQDILGLVFGEVSV